MSLHTAGIDVGTSAVKCALFRFAQPPDKPGESAGAELRALSSQRIRRRALERVIEEVFHEACRSAGVEPGQIQYVATTGENELVPFSHGHFYGMTTHARGALYLIPQARGVLDVGAMHARAIRTDASSRVLAYQMSSQCASGTGQFLENISRYMGVAIEEVGPLSNTSQNPEVISSICAVLAETDVINMISRGIGVADILRGIHQSMAGRLLRLLTTAGCDGVVAVTGGLSADVGLLQCLEELVARQKDELRVQAHPDGVYAGALGAALWAAYRHGRLVREGALV
ncbi:MAG: benzoyl-CoA reductase subunit D [Armatimonadetes bacterium]|nr:benzoyl-CoA reductase subunit D [Armatimonadota bacterium]